jgi:hypothetical protein
MRDRIVARFFLDSCVSFNCTGRTTVLDRTVTKRSGKAAPALLLCAHELYKQPGRMDRLSEDQNGIE